MTDDQFLLKPDVRAGSKLSYPTIWREQKAGRFPPFERISAGRVAMRQSIFNEWVAGRRDWHSAA